MFEPGFARRKFCWKETSGILAGEYVHSAFAACYLSCADRKRLTEDNASCVQCDSKIVFLFRDLRV